MPPVVPPASSTTNAAEAQLPDRYAVLGHPVAHSQSPFIHAEFARQTGEHLVYERVECPPDGFEASVRQFMASGDAARSLGPARGCNITVPFKFQVLPLATQVSDAARLAQAANVLCFDAEGWRCDNTDGAGLVRDILNHAQVPIQGRRVLLLGAGGASAGVLGPLLAAHPAEVTVANRSLDKAESLVRRHRAWAAQHGVALVACGLDRPGTGFDIVLNGTASSLAGAGVPVPGHVLAPGALALDMMYGTAAQPFLQWAQAHQAVGRDGLGMLVEQAAGAFALWRGVMPATAPVLQALRQRLGLAKA